MNKEPTEAQIKEFWGWCGLVPVWGGYGEVVHDNPDEDEPVELDLNNLFKYAIPALNSKTDRHIDLFQSTKGWTCDIGLGDITVEQEEPTLALFWAIWEVKG